MYFIIQNYLNILNKYLNNTSNNIIFKEKFLYHMLIFLKDDWSDEIQCLAIRCFYSLLFHSEFRQKITQNNEVLNTIQSVDEKFVTTKRMVDNFFWEIKEKIFDQNLIVQDKSVVIVYHKNDKQKIDVIELMLKNQGFNDSKYISTKFLNIEKHESLIINCHCLIICFSNSFFESLELRSGK